MQLAALDWTIIVAYFALSLGIGLWFKNRAGESFVEYFASGRSLPWWIAGTSMVATTFAADTPLAVTGLVAKNGLAGNWFWWAFALGGMLTVFVYAKLWRRAGVLTDVELIELRYAGKPASFLRGFRAAYVAIVVNSFIIGWVTDAMITVLRTTVLVDLPTDSSTDLWLVIGLLVLTGIYSVVSGMWGVAITDVVQFLLAMVGCIALAVIAVSHVGGIDALTERTARNFGSTDVFDFVPDFGSATAWMPAGVFLAMALGQWWATWYPGAEPGGGGYIVQRMAACRDERHAVRATLLFQLAHYCVRPWPWILVAFAALALHPELRTWATDDQDATNPGTGFPMLIRELAPVGLRGLLLVTFLAAYMSTISTQMNWGASYVVNDLYKRFVRPQATDRELVVASRRASVLVLILGAVATWYMRAVHLSIEDAWAILAALGGGLGTVFLARWFWWRVSAWSEIAAMLASLALYFGMQAWQSSLPKTDRMADQYAVLLVALGSLAIWLTVTFATKPEPQSHLLAFYRRIRPDGPGWAKVAAAAPEVQCDGTLGRSLLCALLGTMTIWLTLPGIGAVIFSEWGKAAGCLGGAAIAATVMLRLANRLQPRA
ncbi:MAG: Na+:solute symporter [Planctomycetes bacterium]|nr:Na+:solute symporter [Planctomycetota bacterium]